MNKNSTKNLNTIWGTLIVEELIRCGVTYFCISPGSRSTPLTVAAARHEKAVSDIFYDERNAAFHALGYAKGCKQPAVLICTSGSAVANYFPAVVEASESNIPLILLTADRPPELRNSGANQTIQQPRIFGKYVRWEFDFPVPDAEISYQMVLSTIDRAVQQSMNNFPGPVHLNMMFREPFFDEINEPNFDFSNIPYSWENSKNPFHFYDKTKLIHSETAVGSISHLINSNQKIVISVGELTSEDDVINILKLAKKISAPVFPDIQSKMRISQMSANTIYHFDQLLLGDLLKEKIKPDILMHFGGRVISKRLTQWISDYTPEHYLHISEFDQRIDPMHLVSQQYNCNISNLIEAVLPKVNIVEETKLHRQLTDLNLKIEQHLNTFCEKNEKVNEISTARLISRYINSGSGLFLASSMPVRDMDMFGESNMLNIYPTANRGASGIDGLISSACGFSKGIDRQVTLLIGDLAFLHDLNALELVQRSTKPIIIILINNGGGGIFSFLPITKQKDVFESFFGTPHSYTFKNIAKQFNIRYAKASTNKSFVKTYRDVQWRQESAIIEINTNREENLRLHQTLQSELRKVVDEYVSLKMN